MTAELPAGWRRMRLGNVADTALGKMLDRGKVRGGKQVPYLRNVNVQWGRIDTHDVAEMELLDDELARFEVRAGDLLVCEGGEIGRCAIWPGSDTYMAYQKALHRVRPGPDLDARFLRYALEDHARRGELMRRATGSTIKHLPQVALRELPLSLPPLDAQYRIVELLEDHLSRLDAAGGYMAAARLRLARLSEAALSASHAAAGADVPLQTLLAEPLTNGRSVPDGDGAAVLRLTALRSPTVDVTATKSGSWTEQEAAPFRIDQGDLLVSRGNGSLHLVGRAAMVVAPPPPVAFPDTMIRVRPDRRVIEPTLLLALWNGPHVRQQIEAAVRTTAGIYKVNQKQLLGIRVRVPPREHQSALLTRLNSMSENATRLTHAVDADAARCHSLRSALLHNAFLGLL